jgi:GNAT superfamily N-acetyltransferase
VSFSFVDLAPGDPRLASEAFPVLAELRTSLTPSQLEQVYAEGYAQGLRFTAAYDSDGACVGVAGWRVIATTVSLRKLYVDDLVTAAARRGQGVGSALLAELTARGRAAGCRVIDLDSALHRADAHRFYIRERMPIVAFHFGRALD